MQRINVIYTNDKTLTYNKRIKINKEQILFTSLISISYDTKNLWMVNIQVPGFEFILADEDFEKMEFTSIEKAEQAIDEL